MAEASSSYSQIFKASSLMGGVQGLNFLLGMLRTKFSAVLIGPVGTGLLGSYGAILGLVGSVAVGIQYSALRDVAEAAGQEDQQAVGRTILALRRLCLLAGLLGALVMVVLAVPISHWTFGRAEEMVLLSISFGHWTLSVNNHALDIALLGLVVLFNTLSVGQMVLIQGFRRIGDLAQIQFIGALAGTMISVGCYAWLGLHGIVPSLLLMTGLQLAVAWRFTRRIEMPKVSMTWQESLSMAGGIVRLGLVFMWNSLLASLVAYLIRALLTQQLNLEAVGIYTAAFSLSSLFVNTLLGAMEADYYPRLVAADRSIMNRLVNEQTEIGLLLIVPGLLATLSLAPWIIRIFYTEAFLPAAELLQWFVLGCLGRVVSWPLVYVILALGKRKWFFAAETFLNVGHLLLAVVGLMVLGLKGISIGFFALYAAYAVGMYWIVRYLTGFRWSAASRKLMLLLLPLVIAVFLAGRSLPLWPATAFGVAISLTASVLSLRGLVQRIGTEHRIIRMACRVPGMRWACGA